MNRPTKIFFLLFAFVGLSLLTIAFTPLRVAEFTMPTPTVIASSFPLPILGSGKVIVDRAYYYDPSGYQIEPNFQLYQADLSQYVVAIPIDVKIESSTGLKIQKTFLPLSAYQPHLNQEEVYARVTDQMAEFKYLMLMSDNTYIEVRYLRDSRFIECKVVGLSVVSMNVVVKIRSLTNMDEIVTYSMVENSFQVTSPSKVNNLRYYTTFTDPQTGWSIAHNGYYIRIFDANGKILADTMPCEDVKGHVS